MFKSEESPTRLQFLYILMGKSWCYQTQSAPGSAQQAHTASILSHQLFVP